jgi:hypothetical protein
VCCGFVTVMVQLRRCCEGLPEDQSVCKSEELPVCAAGVGC